MKNIVSTQIIVGAFLGMMSLASCDNAEYSPLEDQAFIMQTNTNPNTTMKVFIDQEEVHTDINVRLLNLASEDCKYELVEDQQLLDKFNKENYTTYQFLTHDQYQMSTHQVTVKAGKSISDPTSLNIKPLTREMKDSGDKYAVALTLKSLDNQTEILRPGSNIIYLLDPAIVTSVPVFSPQNNASFTLSEEQSWGEWSVEFCVNMSVLGKKVGEMNNQAIFDASSNLGEEDGQIYIRFGDAPIEGNRLQIKTQGSQMNSRTLFEANKWYHIAFVCTGSKLHLYVDGKLDNTQDMPGKVTNLGTRVKIGNTDWLKADVQMSELRMWSRALSQREVENNMYSTAPDANGLYAYFKLNEGQGKDFKDATGHGNVGKFDNEVWKSNVRLNSKN